MPRKEACDTISLPGPRICVCAVQTFAPGLLPLGDLGGLALEGWPKVTLFSAEAVSHGNLSTSAGLGWHF